MPRGGAISFSYSDGAEIELRLLEIVRGADDRSVLSEQLRNAISDWPSRYHLSARRANLLRPLEHLFRGQKVLEVGAGCGAISRFLGECGASVVAVEGSTARAAVAAARCRDLDSVCVVVDTFDRLQVEPTFDVVCLIGVLEYARLYFPAHEGDAVDAMLAHAVRYLRPGGRLVLAIENQLGLKYFAGYREDHVAQPMFGIEDLYAANGVVTFGKAELAARLHHAGLADLEWLYPFPDYKLPVSILTERALSAHADIDLSPLLSASVVADPQVPDSFGFSLEQAWRPVFRNRLAGELSNSFLVVASAGGKAAVPANALAYHYASERRRVFAKSTSVVLEDGLARVSASPLAPMTPPPDGPVTMQFETSTFMDGRHWQMAFYECLNRRGWGVGELAAWAEVWLAALLARGGQLASGRDKDLMLSGKLIDAVPRNLIVKGSEARFFDLEWAVKHDLPLGYLLFRGVVLSLLGIGSVATPGAGTPLRLFDLFLAVADILKIPLTHEDVRAYFNRESVFQSDVNGCSWVSFDALSGYAMPTRQAPGSTAEPCVAGPGNAAPPLVVRSGLTGLVNRMLGW
jgi:SAM-dependent methyltransferase